RAGRLLLQEVDDLAFVVALEDIDLQAELARLVAHGLVQVVQRAGAVDVRLSFAQKVEVGSMDHNHAFHASDLVTTRRTTGAGTECPISACPMRRGMTHATLPRRAFLSSAMAASTRLGSACGGLSGRPKAWRSSSCESTVRLLHRSRARATRAATRMPKATARPWVTRNAVAASSAWPAVWPSLRIARGPRSRLSLAPINAFAATHRKVKRAATDLSLLATRRPFRCFIT